MNLPPGPQRARSEKKTRHLGLFMGETLHARLFAFAGRKDVSVSRVVRIAVERYLNDREREGDAGA